MNIKARDFESIVQKFQLKTRNAGDRLAWFEYEGKIITRTRRSHGSGDLPFGELICKTMTWTSHLTAEGILPSSST